MIKRHYLYLLLIPLALGITAKFGYAHNITNSLPYKYFFIVKNAKVSSGDYILFKAPQTCQYAGMTLIKQVAGVVGDKLSVVQRDVYINAKFVGTAKAHSKTGKELAVTAAQTIPDNKYYVTGLHVDSYDSRYREVGLINAQDVIGVAFALW